jgi:hypothetical protein
MQKDLNNRVCDSEDVPGDGPTIPDQLKAFITGLNKENQVKVRKLPALHVIFAIFYTSFTCDLCNLS